MKLTITLNNRPVTLDLTTPLAVCAETSTRVMEAVTAMHAASNAAGIAWRMDRPDDNDDFIGLWTRDVEFLKARISGERPAGVHVTTYVNHDLLGEPELLGLFDELIALSSAANASIVLLTTANPEYCPAFTGSEQVLHFDGDNWQLDDFDPIHI